MSTRKVVILTAGCGSRLNERTKYFNKALLKVGDQAVISHIIDLFPQNTQFVIGLGYLGSVVKQYLTTAHPNLKIDYVEIDRYSVPGSGPGYALNKCKEYLKEPFYFCACDTLIKKEAFIESAFTASNYLVCQSIEPEYAADYCTVTISNGYINQIKDKSKKGSSIAFTGLAHIQDWQIFWEAMDKNTCYINKELQLSPALAELPKLECLFLPWIDVGTEQGLLQAKEYYPGLQNLDKLTEELYVVPDNGGKKKVIKYFYDANIISQRLNRIQYLSEATPKIDKHSDNFYSYDFIEGKDLFQVPSLYKELPNLLQFAEDKLWQNFALSIEDKVFFTYACDKFYYHKTLQRLESFYKKTNIKDVEEKINGHECKMVSHYLDKLDWIYLADGVPSGYHGDFQPGNIIKNDNGQLYFIDWRQDFGGIIAYGDRYYDFAKLYTSLLMPHTSIKNGQYNLAKSAGEIFVDIATSQDIRKCQSFFKKWLRDKGYSEHKTLLLTAIVMLNMSPLHEFPLDEWLYYYAKNLLRKATETNK